MGTESMGVAQNIILTHFFTGKEIALALALNVSSSRLGTILNNWVASSICVTLGVPAAFLLGAIFCLVSVIGCVELSRTIAAEEAEFAASHTPNEDSILTSARQAKRQFWIVASVCIAGYCSVIPFTSVFMAYRPVGVSQEVAGHIISIVFMISAIATPMIGRFVDKFGSATYVLVGSCLLLSLAHTMYTTYDHMLVMGFLGVGYAGLVAAIWPLVPMTVSETRIGFGYGMVTALQNLGLTLTPLLVRSYLFNDTIHFSSPS